MDSWEINHLLYHDGEASISSFLGLASLYFCQHRLFVCFLILKKKKIKAQPIHILGHVKKHYPEASVQLHCVFKNGTNTNTPTTIAMAKVFYGWPVALMALIPIAIVQF